MERIASGNLVLIDALWPKPAVPRDALMIGSACLLLAASAQVEFAIPLSPVPVTGQTLAVLLLGAVLGSKRGPLAVLSYLGLGFLGVPVLAGGASGLIRLAGPTGGYLLSFPVAAWVVGYLSERGWGRRLWSSFASMLVGNMVIYILGSLWLAPFVGWGAVVQVGVIPFIAGDILKLTFATLALPMAWKLVGRTGQ